MRATLLMILLVFGLVGSMALTGCSAATPPDLYALSARDHTLHGLRLDGAITRSTPIGRIAPVGDRADLAMLTSAGDGLAFTIDRRANVLHTLRLTDAAVVASVRLDMDVWVTRRGLARAPDGRLFALLPGMELRTIDPATGATAIIGPISGATMIEALAFSPDGELFALGGAGTKFSNALYRVDTLTAEATHLADLHVPDADALAYLDGSLYAADSDGSDAQLWRIDPATGTLVSLGPTGIATLNGLTGARSERAGVLRAPRVEGVLEGQKVEDGQLAVAVEVGPGVAVVEEVEEEQEVEHGEEAIAVGVGGALDAG